MSCRRLRARESSELEAHSRRPTGSVLPLVTGAMLVFIAYLAFAVDVMRGAVTVRKLQFAAQSAALHAMSYAVNADGAYDSASARADITARVLEAGDGGGADGYNDAPTGPVPGEPWRSVVSFLASDVSFINNPNAADSDELFLRVAATREGGDALRLFFLPAVFAANTFAGGSLPDGFDSFAARRVAEVIGQPAARIGAGAPRGAAPGTKAAALAGFACLPLAVSNAQFASLSSPAEIRATYTVDLVSGNSPPPSAAAGHLRGCFVNVAASGGGLSYYGDGQGTVAVDELKRTLGYFAVSPPAGALAPGVVERGSELSAFDPADPDFVAAKAGIVAALAQLPAGRHYIVPVVADDPNFALRQKVVGFARFLINKTVNAAADDCEIELTVAESVPVRNASATRGQRAVPSLTGALLPAPVAPFKDRTVMPDGQSVERRPRSVVLAPAISPRVLPQIN